MIADNGRFLSNRATDDTLSAPLARSVAVHQTLSRPAHAGAIRTRHRSSGNARFSDSRPLSDRRGAVG